MMLPVVVSYGIQLQPPPPNTGMSLFTNVAGTTLADDAFWAEQCKTIPSNTLFLVVDMGAVRDFFKPVAGATFCEMLQFNDKHQWSYDGEDWVTPYYQSNVNNNGGSVDNWSKDYGRAEDKRKYLSFWGTRHGSLTGGCCSTSREVQTTDSTLRKNEKDHPAWGQPCT